MARIAHDEAGLRIRVKEKRLLGQYVGQFKTEHNRQDLSTAYIVQPLRES
ncbi:MAG TPA: hypothetical protein VGS08_02095 [Candidatus Saccharimonadales bacterium]|nr:hypothetical protein [Candidatus Saccharimonadales bacterium]